MVALPRMACTERKVLPPCIMGLLRIKTIIVRVRVRVEPFYHSVRVSIEPFNSSASTHWQESWGTTERMRGVGVGVGVRELQAWVVGRKKERQEGGRMKGGKRDRTVRSVCVRERIKVGCRASLNVGRGKTRRQPTCA